MRWYLAGLVVVGATVGCGSGSSNSMPGGPPPPIAGLTAITVGPANQLLVVDGQSPASQKYTATGSFADGHTEDVTDRVQFGLSDPSLGLFMKDLLTSAADHGGIANVQAAAGDVLATTPVTILIRQRIVDPSSGLAAGVDGKFSAPDDASRAPDVVYPNDGVLLPPNFGKMEVHFLPGANNTLFEVGFSNPLTDVKVYTKCLQPMNGGCIFGVPDAVWKTVATTNRGSSQLTVTVRGTDDKAASVGSSKAVAMQISKDDILGGLYYWTTSNGTGIMRYDFANQQAQASMFVGTNLTGGNCVGCHALSRDGSKLVAEAGGQNDGRLLLLDVAHSTPMVPFGSTAKSTFESWSPMGDQFVGVYGDSGATNYNLMLFNGQSGAMMMPIDGTGTAQHPADHPDWSPDGKSIVYTRVGMPNTLQRMSMGAIEMVRNNGMWNMPTELVPAQPGKNRYYPAFAPDSSFVVFDESTCSTGSSGEDCDADTDPTATLFAVRAKAGSQPVALAKANAAGRLDKSAALTNSFPKWSPFVFQRTGEAGSRLMWVTFSSSRHFGLRNPPTSTGGETQVGSLIWMAAVDPDNIANGIDGSYPAFALPFQDFSTSNHIAQWTTQIVPPIQ